jgi:hypothetical protein
MAMALEEVDEVAVKYTIPRVTPDTHGRRLARAV